jgi:hypothetical protein
MQPVEFEAAVPSVASCTPDAAMRLHLPGRTAWTDLARGAEWVPEWLNHVARNTVTPPQYFSL